MAVVWQRQEDGVLYQVHRRGDRMRLFANGVQHSEFHPKRLVTGSVWDLLWLPALLSEPQRFRRVLILGLGGGTLLPPIRELLAPGHIRRDSSLTDPVVGHEGVTTAGDGP